MRFQLVVLLLEAAITFALPSGLGRRQNSSSEDIASGATIKALAAQAFQNAWNMLPDDGEGCTKKTVQIRTEFRYMEPRARKAYTDAVECIQSKPSILDSNFFVGTKTKFDDFVAQHINKTFLIHEDANFLIWHRYFTWTYHKTLADECGYTGQQPFWEWGLDVASGIPLRESPIFNGDAYSMGSDGTFVPGHPGLLIPLSNGAGTQPTNLTLPAGTGGGCVFSGPFTNMTVNLGPLADPNEVPVTEFSYNPRCLIRDLSLETAQNWTSFANYTPIVQNAQTPFEFQTLLDGDPRNYKNDGTFGPHGGGHFIISGDPGDDFRVSPGDPMFYLHHGQIDRLYWIWQNLDIDQRSYRTGNIPNLTTTLLNEPPSPLGTLQDPLDVGPMAPVITNQLALDTLAGPFCYVYQ